jgi:hypothetical protein
MIILMKFTSRGRYETLKKCVQAYYDKANDTKKMVWLFTIDNDDDTFQMNDFESFLRGLNIQFELCFGESFSKIDAINRDVNTTETYWDILLNISDDQMPILQGYDDLIRDKMPNDLDASLWFNDGHQDDIITQEILGRKYYENQGYIYYPAYRSFFCDNESTLVAKKKGKLVKSPLCIIKHFHPVWGVNEHIQDDELYRRNNIHWEHDKQLFNQRQVDGIF